MQSGGLFEYLQNLGIFWRWASSKHKINFFICIGMMAVSSCLEVINLGLLIPFLMTLSDPETLALRLDLFFTLEFFSLMSPDNFIILITFVFIMSSIFSYSIRFILGKILLKFSFSVGEAITQHLFNYQILSNFEDVANSSSSEIIEDLTSRSRIVIEAVLIPIMNAMSSGLVTFVIMFALLAFNPLYTLLIIFTLISCYSITIAITRKKIIHRGKQIFSANLAMVKIMQEVHTGIREIFVHGRQNEYAKSFKDLNHSSKTNESKNRFISSSPRFIVEFFLVLMMVLFGASSAVQGDNFTEVIVELGFIAMGIQKVFPHMQLIYWAISTAAGSKNYLVSIALKLRVPNSVEAAKLDKRNDEFQEHITFESIGFQRDDTEIFRNVSFNIFKSEFVAIVGPTGCGKSTFLDVAAGLLPPSFGSIEVDGRILHDSDLELWRDQVGFVSQHPLIINGSILENITFGASGYVLNDIWDVLKAVEMYDFVFKLSRQLESLVGEDGIQLSGGQKQRIALARELFKNPKLLILDEATSALDKKTEKKILNYLKNTKKTIIFATHSETVIECSDKLVDFSFQSKKVFSRNG